MILADPARILSCASIAAFMPDPHILLMVVAPTESGSPAPTRRLACRCLALACWQNTAHNDVFDIRGLQATALHRFGNGCLAQIHGREASQLALKGANGGSGHTYNNNGILRFHIDSGKYKDERLLQRLIHIMK
jgi:hypothetical protein